MDKCELMDEFAKHKLTYFLNLTFNGIVGVDLQKVWDVLVFLWILVSESNIDCFFVGVLNFYHVNDAVGP